MEYERVIIVSAFWSLEKQIEDSFEFVFTCEKSTIKLRNNPVFKSFIKQI